MAIAEPNSAAATRNRTGGGGSERRTQEEAEQLVGPLLARANLLRMRCQWDEAVAVCTEALRRAPESATAHTLLGDIYEAQGKFDDAMQWYGMAVDLAPDRPGDREKLERVTQAQRARLKTLDGERAAALAAYRVQMEGRLDSVPGAPAGSSAGRVAAERTVEWFDRIFPPGRSESVARLIFVACGVIASIFVAAVVFVSFNSHGRSMVAFAHVEDGLPTLEAPQPPVIVDVPATPDAMTAVTNAAERRPAAVTPPVSGVSAATPLSTAAPTADADVTGAGGNPQAIDGRVSAVLAQTGVAVTAVRADERAESVPLEIDIAVPIMLGEAGPATQERVARAAALAARTLTDALGGSAAGTGSANGGKIVVRAALRAPGEPGPTSDVLVFYGETSVAAIRSVDPTIAATETLLAQFTGIAWQPLPGAAMPAVSATSSPAAVTGSPSTPSSPVGTGITSAGN
jgi:hypothetical protein